MLTLGVDFLPIDRRESPATVLKIWLANGLLLAGSLFIALLIVEALLFVVLSHPSLISARDGLVGRVRSILRQYYMESDRAIVQFEPECFRADPELTYTLKPETSCTVVNREHVAEYRTNRQGLRDSESALVHPAIVVVGDSHAMGWGVAEAESFPRILEREIEQPVLNAAISSYGTARELALLERLPLPEFPVVVIQYCDNDFRENKFLVDKGVLEITPQAQFHAVAANAVKRRRYYPFKHALGLMGLVRASLRAPQPSSEPDTNSEEARYFLEVLLRHGKLIEGKTVLVIEVNGNSLNDAGFIEALTVLLSQPRYAALKRSLVPIDVSKALAATDYYVLDDHMTRAGHAKVARLLASEITRRAAFAPR